MVGTMTLTDEISDRMTVSSLFPSCWGDWSGLLGQRREAAVRKVSDSWIVFSSPVEKGRSTCQSTEVLLSQWETVFTPRTDLGKRLYALRTKAVAAGMKLFSEDEVLEEVKRRRGEIEENETDLH